MSKKQNAGKQNAGKQNTQRQKKHLAAGLRVYLIILCVAVIAALTALWVSLYRYQRDIDAAADEETEEAAQACFEDYLEGLTIEDWVSLWQDAHAVTYDSWEDIAAYLQDHILDADYSCYKVSGYTLEAPCYTMVVDGQRLADFYLTPPSSDADAGADGKWTVDRVEILLTGESSTVTIPESLSLTINGTRVPTEDIAETYTAEVDDYTDKLEAQVTFATYDVGGLVKPLSEEDVVITDTAGAQVTMALGADGVYYETMSSASGIDLQAKSQSFIRALMYYYTMGKENTEANMNAALSRVAAGSQAAQIVSGSISGVEWQTADATATYDYSTSEACRLADNCCFVDVTYTLTGESKLYSTGDGIYRVYLLDSGSGYQIVQFGNAK